MSIRQAPKPAPKPAILCANGECDNFVERGQEYSFVLTLATRGADARLDSFQCPPVEEIDAGNLDAQHFCCSIACAALVAHACIDEHLVSQHHAHVEALATSDKAEAEEKAALDARRKEIEAAQ